MIRCDWPECGEQAVRTAKFWSMVDVPIYRNVCEEHSKGTDAEKWVRLDYEVEGRVLKMKSKPSVFKAVPTAIGTALDFLIEMLMKDNERALVKVLYENPEDESVRDVYTDYLLEAGRTMSAELIRGGWTPFSNEVC